MLNSSAFNRTPFVAKTCYYIRFVITTVYPIFSLSLMLVLLCFRRHITELTTATKWPVIQVIWLLIFEGEGALISEFCGIKVKISGQIQEI